MAGDIFISFASKDVKVAMTLCSALESRGFSCWISARDIQPGANFQVSIVQALRHARIMLLVFTANSNTSEEMTKELALASQQKIIVIPLRVEDVTPNDAFAYEFATRQWIDAFADWESSIDQLSRRIGQALEVNTTPPPAPVVAAPPEAEAAPSPVVSLATTREKRQPPTQAVDTPAAAKAKPESKVPQHAPAAAEATPEPRKRRLAVPIAAAAALLIAGAVAATSLLRSGEAAPKVAAAPAATPRLSEALVAQPAEPSPELVTEAAADQPVAKPKRKRIAAETNKQDDIPY